MKFEMTTSFFDYSVRFVPDEQVMVPQSDLRSRDFRAQAMECRSIRSIQRPEGPLINMKRSANYVLNLMLAVAERCE